MAINPLLRTSTVRLMGLSSGLDTDTIIKQSLRLQQMKIDSQLRSRTLFEWKQQSLNSIADELTDFRRSYLTVMGPNAMRLSSVYNTTIATVSGKNAGAVTVTTTVNSSTGTIRIGQIASLAKNTSATTAGGASKSGDGFKLTDKLGDIIVNKREIGFDAGGEIKVTVKARDNSLTELTLREDFTAADLQDELATAGISFGPFGTPPVYIDRIDININGKDITIRDTDDAQALVAKVNAASSQDYTASGRINFDMDGRANIRINGVVIGLNRDMTIDDMLNKVNESKAGVIMSYDRMSDKFTVESNKAGDTAMSVWGLGAFGIADGTYQNGSLAKVMINGEWVEKDSNTFDFRGAKITLNYMTEAGDEDTVVTFKRDATETIDKIKGFIDAYNTIFSKLESLIKERKTGTEVTYKPLTDEEKSVMSDKQIEEWEAIAKKGILRSDAGIQNLLNNLRGALFEKVASAGLSPSQIGLSTGRWDSGMGGQIVLDEVKLREALEKDPERVMNVFMGGADDEVSAGKGLLWRMEDIMTGYINGTQSRTIDSLESSIKKANEQMEKLQLKMYEEEERLYQKFAAMETALSKIQSQSDWFSAMLDSSNKK